MEVPCTTDASEGCNLPHGKWDLNYVKHTRKLVWSNDEEKWYVSWDGGVARPYFYHAVSKRAEWQLPQDPTSAIRKLIVLDLSHFIRRSQWQAGKRRERTVRADDNGESFRILVRSLRSCGYDVAMWTCPNEENAQADLAMISPEPDSLLFCWTQREAFDTDRRMPNGKPIRLKRLSTILAAYPQHTERSVLILDDEPEKLEDNPPGTGLIVSHEDVLSSDFLLLVSQVARHDSIADAVLRISEHPFVCNHRTVACSSTNGSSKRRYNGSLGTPAERDGRTPKGIVWNTKVGTDWFYYVATSCSIREALARLALMAETFPSHKEYCEGNLRRSVTRWADCTTIWSNGMLMKYSNLAEGWFHSFKIRLGKNVVDLCQMLEFTNECCQARSLNYGNTRHLKVDNISVHISQGALSDLQTKLRGYGFEPVVDLLSRIDRDDQMIILTQIERSLNWGSGTFVGFVTRDLVASAEGYVSSGARFLHLVRAAGFPLSSDIVVPGWSISTSNIRRGHLVQLIALSARGRCAVYVSPEGGLACMCNFFAQFSMFCQHMWALFRAGYVAFSPRHHLDRTNRNLCSDAFVLAPSRSILEPLVSRSNLTVDMSWARRVTKDWENAGGDLLDTTTGQGVRAPPPAQEVDGDVPDREMLRKKALQLVEYCLTNHDGRTRFEDLHHDLMLGTGDGEMCNPARQRVGEKRRCLMDGA